MRKLASALIALTLFTTISMASAQTTESSPGSGGTMESDKMMIAPLPPGDSNEGIGFLGQDHFYTVTFRGNGEAVVNLKAIFANTGEGLLNTLEFRIPKIDPQDITAYQVTREKECVRWSPVPFGQQQDLLYREPTCAQYQEPNYYNYYYGNNQYQKAEVSKNGDTLTVTLPTSVEPNKSASIILYYRGVGYVTKNWAGAFTFNFESVKVQDKIRTLQVGINTDSDMIMKQAQGDVNYRLQQADSAGMAKMEAAPTAMSNAQFDQFYQGIGYGTLVKNASELQPLDSYTVTGEYAKSGWQLYANNILTGVLIGFVLLLVALFGIRFAVSRMRSQSGGKNAALTSRDVMIAGATGFGSALLMLCYTIMLMIIVYSITFAGYGYMDVTQFIMIALMIVSSAVYMFLFITPAVVVGVKRGLWAGVITAVTSLFLLIIFLVLTIGGYMIVRSLSPNQGYPVYPMMKGGTMMDQSLSEPAQVAPDMMMQTEPASPPSAEQGTQEIELQR